MELLCGRTELINPTFPPNVKAPAVWPQENPAFHLHDQSKDSTFCWIKAWSVGQRASLRIRVPTEGYKLQYKCHPPPLDVCNFTLSSFLSYSLLTKLYLIFSIRCYFCHVQPELEIPRRGHKNHSDSDLQNSLYFPEPATSSFHSEAFDLLLPSKITKQTERIFPEKEIQFRICFICSELGPWGIGERLYY